MKHLFFIVLTVAGFLLAANSQVTAGGFTIEGRLRGAADGLAVYLYDLDEQRYLDTAIVYEERFLLEGRVLQPTTCWIRTGDEYAIIQVENTRLRFEAPLKDMRLYNKAQGGREQELQNALSRLQRPYELRFFKAYDSLTRKLFRDKTHQNELAKVLNDYQDSAHAIYIDFGMKHPDSYLGLDILYRNRELIGKDHVARLYQQMSPERQRCSKGEALALFAFGEGAHPGRPFPDFSATTLSGAPFTLSSLKGKYIFLSFWTAACGPCRKENRALTRQYDDLSKTVSIVSFSLDKQRAVWTEASKEDQIRWTNVSDLEGDNGRIKTIYNVQALPAAFLIDPEGIIVEKFVGFDEATLVKIKRLSQGIKN